MRDLRRPGPPPDLATEQARAAPAVEAARATFTSEWPCAWCGNPGTRSIPVVPAVVEDGAIKKRPNLADICFDCARRLKVYWVGQGDTGWKVAMQKSRAAEKRKEARDSMKANQGSLFDPDDGPTDALTGG